MNAPSNEFDKNVKSPNPAIKKVESSHLVGTGLGAVAGGAAAGAAVGTVAGRVTVKASRSRGSEDWGARAALPSVLAMIGSSVARAAASFDARRRSLTITR